MTRRRRKPLGPGAMEKFDPDPLKWDLHKHASVQRMGNVDHFPPRLRRFCHFFPTAGSMTGPITNPENFSAAEEYHLNYYTNILRRKAHSNYPLPLSPLLKGDSY